MDKDTCGKLASSSQKRSMTRMEELANQIMDDDGAPPMDYHGIEIVEEDLSTSRDIASTATGLS